MIVTLVGKSQKGKNRIKEHGDKWEVVREDDKVICLDDKPGMLLQSPDGYQKWFALRDDKDFIMGE
jgi:hypothetical protein